MYLVLSCFYHIGNASIRVYTADHNLTRTSPLANNFRIYPEPMKL